MGRWSPGCAPGLTLLGFASDEGVRRNQGRVGAAKGPDHIRQALVNLPWRGQTPVWDSGNIACPGNDLEQAQQGYARQVSVLLNQGQMVAGLGGGHEIGWGSYLGLMLHLQGQPTRNVGIINFDAHFDLRLPEAGASSGTPFWQAAE